MPPCSSDTCLRNGTKRRNSGRTSTNLHLCKVLSCIICVCSLRFALLTSGVCVCIMQCTVLLYCTVEYAVEHYTICILFEFVYFSVLIIFYCSLCTEIYCIVFYCFVLYSPVLYSIALYCTVMNCILYIV